MKKIAAVLTTVVMFAVAAGLLLFPSFPKKESKTRDESVEQAKSDRKARSDSKETVPAAAPDIADLARQKNPPARDQLVDMYVNWAGKPNKTAARRSIIREILANEEPAMALKMILTAVSRDPTPFKSDEMLTPIARDLVGIWKDTDVYAKGMDLMRLSDDMKSQAVLAESLSVRFTSPPSGMMSVEPQRYALVSDLSYLYRNSGEADFKTQLLQNIQSVGGSEMAELAVDPGNPNAAFYKKMEAERTQAVNTAPPSP